MVRRRAILTDSERESLEEGEDAKSYYQVVSRVKKKINRELTQDIQILRQHHPELYNNLLEVVEGNSEWIRDELETKRKDIDSEFPDNVVPKLTRFSEFRLGLWTRINTGSDYSNLIKNVEDVAEHLHSLGYNVRSAHDAQYDPDVGEPHYEGHLYALPAEIGIPEYPVGEMPVGSDHVKKFEWKANKNTKAETTEE